MSKRQACSICQDPIEMNWMGWADGHNAMPVNDGRCCDRCNDSIVLHARIELADDLTSKADELRRQAAIWSDRMAARYPAAEGSSVESG
jgi:hypothetical protein